MGQIITRSDPALNVGKIHPDFHAAEVRAFRANRRRNSSTQNAWRADISRELRKNFANLGDFFH